MGDHLLHCAVQAGVAQHLEMGGEDGGVLVAKLFGNTISASATSSGAGCAGSRTVPSLSAAGLPVVGSSNLRLDLVSELPLQPSVFGVANARQTTPLAGCTIYSRSA